MALEQKPLGFSMFGIFLSTFSVPKQLDVFAKSIFFAVHRASRFPEIKCDMASTLPPINFHPTQQNLL